MLLWSSYIINPLLYREQDNESIIKAEPAITDVNSTADDAAIKS